MSYLQVMAFRKKRDGSWTKDNLGYAKPSDKGGYDLTLYAIPAPTIMDGNAVYRVSVRPPKDAPNNAAPAKSQAPLDDEIPF